MKLERTVLVRTPDGVDHPSTEAAKKHLFGLHLGVLGNATSKDFEDAVAFPNTENATLRDVREAVREVFLAMWPRASKGKSRTAKTDPAAGGEGTAHEASEAGGEPAAETTAASNEAEAPDEAPIAARTNRPKR